MEMEQAFDRFFRYGWPWLWRDNKLFELESQRMPSFDVINRDNEIFVRAEIPGIEKQDLNISITDRDFCKTADFIKSSKDRTIPIWFSQIFMNFYKKYVN